MMKLKHFLIVLATSMAFAGCQSIQSGEDPSRDQVLSLVDEEPTIAISPTPFPFQELTIPYLRSRTYESRLNDRQTLGVPGNYTNYLTSYTSDGLTINALLTIPTEVMPEGGFPAVVFVHGYIPPQEYETTKQYAAYVDYLASRGIVVFKIDLRGHGNSEGEPGGAYYSGDYVIDTLHAYRALQSIEEVNPERVGLWGHSMAGNVILRSVAAIPDIPRAVIWAGAGFSYEDLSQFGIDDTSYQSPSEQSERRRERDELFETYGRFDPGSDFWKQVPPTNYLDGVTTTIQLHHASNDPVVSVQYSRNLSTMLDQAGIEHELFEYQSGGHNISSPAYGQAMTRSAGFLGSY